MLYIYNGIDRRDNVKLRKYHGMFEVQSLEKSRQVWSQHVEHMQVLNGTGPGVRRSERPS